MSRILDLPLLSFSVETGTNEDWTDAWAYVDVNGAPISGAGITLNMMMRATADAASVQIVASSVSGAIGGLPLNGALVWGGTGMNVVALAIPVDTMQRIPPGSYVAEVLAIAEGRQKVIATIAVAIVRGVVR